MALTLRALELLTPHIRGRSVLCLGYPDILATPEEASAVIGATVTRTSDYGAAHKRRAPMVDTMETFLAAGADDVEFVDAMPSRGAEKKADLNIPQWFGAHGLVIDAGTIEHCANIGEALCNAAAHVHINSGIVFHSPPLSMANHGFYNVSPTLLVDFYEQNGWEVLHLSGFVASPPYHEFDVPRFARFRPPDNAALYFLARRGANAKVNALWPVQHKYL